MQSYYAPTSNRVRLDDYICDLNLEIAPGGYACHPLSAEGFSYMWGGCKATYGIRTGKACFEVKVTEYCEISTKDVDSHVTRVGWSTDSATLQLGEDKNSFGFGGTGKKSVNRKFANYGRRFEKGDVVGCYLAMENGWVDISYSVNGRYCGSAFKIRWMTDEALFPHILTKNCKLEVNFGQALHPYFSLQPGYKLIDHIPTEFRIAAVRPPTTQSDCEIIMMVGLPGVGKSTWAMNYAKIHPSKKYVILGTDSIIDKMRVLGLPRKNNFGGRWDVLIKQASDCFNVLLKKASNLPINLILDQTNVYASARRRKVKQYRDRGYTINAMVLVPRDEDMVRRSQQRTIEEGKEVPESAVLDMKANFSLPDESEHLFDNITFLELQKADAQTLVEQYNREAMSKGHRSNVQKRQGSNANQTERYQRFPSSNARPEDRFKSPSSNERHEGGYPNQNTPSAPKWEDDTKGLKKRAEPSGFGPPEKLRRSDSPNYGRSSYPDSQSYYGSDSRQDPYKARDSRQREGPGSQAVGRSGYEDSSRNDAPRLPPRPDPYLSQPPPPPPPPTNESDQQTWGRAYNDVKTEPRGYDDSYSRPKEPETWPSQNPNTNNSYYNNYPQQVSNSLKQEPSYGDTSSSQQGGWQQTAAYPGYGDQPVKQEAPNAGNWPSNQQGNFPPENRQGPPQGGQYNNGAQSYYNNGNQGMDATKTENKEDWRGYGDAYGNQYNYNNQGNQYNSSGFDPNNQRNSSQAWSDNSRQGYDQGGYNQQQTTNNYGDARPPVKEEQTYPPRSSYSQDRNQDYRSQPMNTQQGYSYGDQQMQQYPSQRDFQPPLQPKTEPDPYSQQGRPMPPSFQDPSQGQPPMRQQQPYPQAPPPGGEQYPPINTRSQGDERNPQSWDQSRNSRGGREIPEDRYQPSDYGGRTSGGPPPASGNTSSFSGGMEQERSSRQPGGFQSRFSNDANSAVGDKRQAHNFDQQRQAPPPPRDVPPDSRRSDRDPYAVDGPDRDAKDRRPMRSDRDKSSREGSRGRSRPDDDRRSRRDDRDDSRSRGRDSDRSRGLDRRDDRKSDRRDQSRSRTESRRRSPPSRRSDSKPSRGESEKREDRRDDSRSRRDERRPRDDDKPRDQRNSSRERRREDHPKTSDSHRPSNRGDAPEAQRIPPGRGDRREPQGNPVKDARAPVTQTPPQKRDGLLPPPNTQNVRPSPSDRAGLTDCDSQSTTVSKLASVDFDKLKASLASIRRQNQEGVREDPSHLEDQYGGDMDITPDEETPSVIEVRRPPRDPAPQHGPVGALHPVRSPHYGMGAPRHPAPNFEGGDHRGEEAHHEPAHGQSGLRPRMPHGPRARRPPPPRMSLLGEAPHRGPRAPRPHGLMDPRLRGASLRSRPQRDESMSGFGRPRRPLLQTPGRADGEQGGNDDSFYDHVEQNVLEQHEDDYPQEEYYEGEAHMQHQFPRPMMRPRLRAPRPMMRRPPRPGMRPPGMPQRLRGPRGASRPLLAHGPPRRPPPPRMGLM